MVMKVITLLLMLCMCSSNHGYGEATRMSTSREEDLELERELKSLNKPPVKTIQFKEGDIVDCIDINKQPSLDHPLLKNHKVQMRPGSFPAGMTKTLSNESNPLRIRLRRESCPFGTVPIQRTRKEDLVRARSLSKQLTTNVSNTSPSFPGQHVVYVKMKESQDPIFYGAEAVIIVYNLSVAQDQVSSSNIWLQNGPLEQVDHIIAGWTVSPALNGDSVTRLFTYWSADDQSTGCYNTICRGFVQVDPKVGPGSPLLPASVYGGDPYGTNFLIFQDRPTGNWWFVLGDNREVSVGYWPKEIFNHLKNGAKQVAWGGVAMAGKDGISPPMGNGHMPDGDYRHSCFFEQVRYVNGDNTAELPSDDDTEDYVDKPSCYGLQNDKRHRRKKMGYSFKFGGPGGHCD